MTDRPRTVIKPGHPVFENCYSLGKRQNLCTLFWWFFLIWSITRYQRNYSQWNLFHSFKWYSFLFIFWWEEKSSILKKLRMIRHALLFIFFDKKNSKNFYKSQHKTYSYRHLGAQHEWLIMRHWNSSIILLHDKFEIIQFGISEEVPGKNSWKKNF